MRIYLAFHKFVVQDNSVGVESKIAGFCLELIFGFIIDVDFPAELQH